MFNHVLTFLIGHHVHDLLETIQSVIVSNAKSKNLYLLGLYYDLFD